MVNKKQFKKRAIDASFLILLKSRLHCMRVFVSLLKAFFFFDKLSVYHNLKNFFVSLVNFCGLNKKPFLQLN